MRFWLRSTDTRSWSVRLVQCAVETVGAPWRVLQSYAAAVYRATRPGATLLISCFSDTNPAGEEWPRPAVSRGDACVMSWAVRVYLPRSGHSVASSGPAKVATTASPASGK